MCCDHSPPCSLPQSLCTQLFKSTEVLHQSSGTGVGHHSFAAELCVNTTFSFETNARLGCSLLCVGPLCRCQVCTPTDNTSRDGIKTRRTGQSKPGKLSSTGCSGTSGTQQSSQCLCCCASQDPVRVKPRRIGSSGDVV